MGLGQLLDDGAAYPRVLGPRRSCMTPSPQFVRTLAMNIELFTAFVLVTLVLIIAPGPIVTLVISTGVSQGPRAALTTVAGTTLGNALLLSAIAVGLDWV